MPFVISDVLRKDIVTVLSTLAGRMGHEITLNVPKFEDVWTALADGQGDAPVDLQQWCETCKEKKPAGIFDCLTCPFADICTCEPHPITPWNNCFRYNPIKPKPVEMIS